MSFLHQAKSAQDFVEAHEKLNPDDLISLRIFV